MHAGEKAELREAVGAVLQIGLGDRRAGRVRFPAQSARKEFFRSRYLDGGELAAARIGLCLRAREENRKQAKSSDKRHRARVAGKKLHRMAKFYRATERLNRLFDGDGFREIARLIDVATAAHGDVVGEHLERNDFQNRRDQIGRGGNFDDVIGASREPGGRLR